MQTKTCKRCGRERHISEFRPYYGKPGTYSYCKICEKIEQRRKYLVGKEQLSEDEAAELQKINVLYDRHQAAGRQVPVRRPRQGINDLLDDMLDAPAEDK